MRKVQNEKGKSFILSLVALILTILSLVFFRVLAASSFESTENVPLVTGLLIGAGILGAIAAVKDFFHVPSLLFFAVLSAAAAAFAAGRASYVAFYLSGDVMNTGLSVFFLITCILLVLGLVMSIAAMKASGTKKSN
ncbi:MAG: hypothetical protein IKO13_01000 [Oscillospiraceae bacterium]|nr:hypothetical protein [Clostridia bacterium]MBR4550845.1 hypothetical protein [Oscillospiraceae bacterium]